MKRELQKGLKIRKDLLGSRVTDGPDTFQNVLMKCVFEGPDFYGSDPNARDYMIYFSFFMVEALMKAENCIKNKHNSYMDLFKEVLIISFNLDENANLRGFEDFEKRHYDWIF